MAKEKKIVKVEKSEKTSGNFKLDENRKIVKVEDKGDRKERAKNKNCFRFHPIQVSPFPVSHFRLRPIRSKGTCLYIKN